MRKKERYRGEGSDGGERKRYRGERVDGEEKRERERKTVCRRKSMTEKQEEKVR